MVYLYENADLTALVFHRGFAERVAEALVATPRVKYVIEAADELALGNEPSIPGAVAYEDALGNQSSLRTGEHAFPERSGDDVYVLYTGGTTGRPKGVVWRQEDIWRVLAGGYDFYSGEPIADEYQQSRGGAAAAEPMRWCMLPPLIHTSALMPTFNALFSGNTVIFEPKFDAAQVWKVVAEYRPQVMVITGDAMGRPLVEAHHELQPDASSLAVLASGAALFSGSVKDAFFDVFPNLMISDSVGSSETGFGGIGFATKGLEQRGGPKVGANRFTVVVDDDNRVLEPGSGAEGWLAKLGNVPLGYYKDPVKSAEIFREVNGARAVVTGDRARIEDDGSVTLLGRGNMVVNTGGEEGLRGRSRSSGEGPSRHLRRDSDRCSGRAVGQSGGGSASHPRRCGTGFRIHREARPQSPRRLQDSAFLLDRRRGRSSAERQAGLPLGQGVLTEQRPGPPDRLALTRNTRHPAPIRKGASAMPEIDLPDGFDVTDPHLYGERVPLAEFAELRRCAPVWWNAQEPGTGGFHDGGCWVVSRHADVRDVSLRSEEFSSNVNGCIPRHEDNISAEELEATKHVLINKDAPEHTQLRKLVARLFTPRSVEAMRAGLEARAEDIALAAVAEGSGDFVSQVASELPMQAISGADRCTAGRAPSAVRMVESDDGIRRRVARRRVSDGVGADPGLRLSTGRGETGGTARRHHLALGACRHRRTETHPEQFGFFVIMLAVAGNETTRNATTLGMMAFLEHPDQWELYKRERPRTAADEIIRWASPLTSMQRTAVVDTQIAGTAIAKGQRVVLLYGSANFDETVFGKPRRLRHHPRPEPAPRVRRNRAALLRRRQPGQNGGRSDLRQDRRSHARHQQARRSEQALVRLAQRDQGIQGRLRQLHVMSFGALTCTAEELHLRARCANSASSTGWAPMSQWACPHPLSDAGVSRAELDDRPGVDRADRIGGRAVHGPGEFHAQHPAP